MNSKRLNFKRILLSLFLVLVILVSNVSYAAMLSDVSGYKYEASILKLVEKEVIKGFQDGSFRAEDALERDSAAALLFRTFKLAPVYPIETPEPDKDGKVITKSLYSTDTTTANLASAMLPAAPESMGTWTENAMNAVLEARLLDTENFTKKVTKEEFAIAIAKGILGADKNIDFLVVGKEKGILPGDFSINNDEITRGEAAFLLDFATKDLKIISVMATSDIHGNVIPYKPSGSPVEVGGAAKAAFQFKEMIKRNPNTLILDAGDSPYNTDIVNFTQGRASVELMNAQGYDATALGNHDFDYSFANLQSLAKNAKYAMLSANTYLSNGSFPKGFKSYITKDLDGVKVGVVGLTDSGSKATTHYENTKEIEFHDHWDVGVKTVKE